MQWTTNAQQVAPSAAVGVTLTPPGSAWGNSAYVELVASVAAASVLTSVVFVAPNVGVEFEIDIATGAAASEVVIATVRGAIVDNSYGTGVIQFPLPIDNIANGARLSARMRVSTTSVSTWKVACTYLLKPVTGTLLTTANPLLVAPSAATGVAVTAGSSFASGSWAQLIASTASAIVIAGVQMKTGGVSQAEIDIGTGGAGSETVIYTMRIYQQESGVGGGAPYVFAFPIPFDNIATTTRVALRARSSVNSQVFTTALMYYTKPL